MSNHSGPNILFVFDDQHRFDYLRCAGADFIRTPNIDRLAARGVRFTHATTNCPVCAPARIGLATGLQPCHLGSLDNNSFLPLSAATYYQRLRDSGYRVGCVGKLDLAKPEKVTRATRCCKPGPAGPLLQLRPPAEGTAPEVLRGLPGPARDGLDQERDPRLRAADGCV